MTDLVLIRDGTIVGTSGIEIDLRTPDGDVWLTVKADSLDAAEAVSDALEKAFPPTPEPSA